MKLLSLIGVFLITFHVVPTCPTRAAMSNFNTTRFLGTWYNIKRSSNARVTYKCFQNHFSRNEAGVIFMVTKYYNTSSASYISFPGVLNKMDAASPEAKFNLVRSDQANSFYVLGTDYLNYAVMCWYGPKRNTTEHIAQTIFLKLHCVRLCKRLYLMIVSTDVVTAERRGHTSLIGVVTARYFNIGKVEDWRFTAVAGSGVGGVTWVSSRYKTLDATYQAKADQVLPPGDYLASDQSGCP
uniref:Lipocalin/cytosolic fatty-acid binding domain-containing protein n=1 Tax=Timema cristinae TaxID=61476 RepID=A0A7R9CM00_TIMCR|nr:unnamed protein product [Timema cristinae]